jgi:hypothetical protein
MDGRGGVGCFGEAGRPFCSRCCTVEAALAGGVLSGDG